MHPSGIPLARYAWPEEWFAWTEQYPHISPDDASLVDSIAMFDGTAFGFLFKAKERLWATCDAPQVVERAKTIYAGATWLLNQAREDVFAVPDTNRSTHARFLQHLGFSPIGEGLWLRPLQPLA